MCASIPSVVVSCISNSDLCVCHFIKFDLCVVCCIGVHFKHTKVPVRFDTTTIGKRKAEAGVKVTKRGHCLSVDN